MNTISVEELEKIDSSKITIVDVRPADQYSRGSFPGAVNIPLDEFEERMESVDKEKMVYVLCHTGDRSRDCVEKLSDAGYEAVNIEGGYRSFLRMMLGRFVENETVMAEKQKDIEKSIKDALNASYPEMFELYDKVINWEYVRNKDIYEQINAEYIPFEENGQLKQITEAIIDQSFDDLENVTNSLGFYLDYGNSQKVLTPLSQVYTKYLDAACYDIVTGAFDYNSVLRRVVTQLTNSGLRQIDYSSGRANRVDVAARRAVMTGVAKLTHKITEYHMKQLGCEYVEVSWHAGARPSHSVWQGKVYKWNK